MENRKSVAILCAGGPAPGINTVIATITKLFLRENYRVLGLSYGYKTIFTDNPVFIDLTYDIADRIYDKGGSYLKMSRYKPKPEEYSPGFFQKENVSLLVTIGGDDTASTANKVSQFLAERNIQIQNIHVPKTIDNDLPLPDNLETFGYQTAKNEGVRIGRTVFEDARTSDSWFIISAMGREAGHLAVGIGNACHFPMIVLPEMFKNVEIDFDKIVNMIVSSMVKRRMMGLEFGAAVVSEGVFHYISEEKLKTCDVDFTYDEHGHPELGNVSKAHIFNILVQKRLKALGIKFKSRPVEIGYEIRCSPPIAFDLRYCTNLGYAVKELYDQGESRCIALATPMGEYRALYMKDIANEEGVIQPRLVDIDNMRSRLTLRTLECVRKPDYEEAKKYLKNPEEFDLSEILKMEV